jgi:hypothetical protein
MVGINWIGLVQVRDKWRAVVNEVMNLWVTYNMAAQLVASRVMFSSIELDR